MDAKGRKWRCEDFQEMKIFRRRSKLDEEKREAE
jgi:hypothetical protein